MLGARWFILFRIQRLKGSNHQHRAAGASRMFACRRAYAWNGRHIGLALTLGWDWQVQRRAEAALLDEFDPLETS